MLYTFKINRIIYVYLVLFVFLLSCESSQKTNNSSQTDTTLIESIKKSHLDSLEKQYFTISNDSTHFLITKKGTCLVVHPQSFIDTRDSLAKGSIQIELREAQEMQDFVKARISTVSDGKILQTVGSYYLDATQNGKKIKINPNNQGIYIAIPTPQKDTSMYFFVGDPTKQGDINWKLDKKREEKIDAPTPPKAMLEEFGLTLDEQKLKKQYEETISFLKGIEKNYKKEGSKYVFKDSKSVYSESWEVSFVEKIRRKLKNIEWIQKHLSDRQTFIAQKNAKLKEAWNKYYQLNHEWKKQNKKVLEPTFYEYKLTSVGWFNIDKFVTEDLVTYSGEILNQKGEKINYARVHLVSEKERIHLQSICETGHYQFEFLKDKEFKIIVARGKEWKEIKLDGSKKKIPDIVF